MAALGKILRKGTGAGSSLDSVKYERVNQDPSDNEEEDDDVIVIYQDGVPIEQNGNHKKMNKNHGAARSVAEEAIEKGLIQKATITKTSSDVEVKVMGKHGILSRTRITCFVLTLILAIGLVFALVFILPIFKVKRVKVHHHKASSEWIKEYEDFGTESLVRLYDVDGDGRLDIIHSFIATEDFGSLELTRQTGKTFCKKRGMAYPCVGHIVALRGYDGLELWRIYSHSGIFEMNCGNIDINKDGHMDCLASGRLSTILAFDPTNGTVLWRGDKDVLEDHWNTYNALIIPDLTHDGISEVILSHGGDFKYPPTVVDREAGRLILVDGATGEHIGQYLEMPNDKETYMSPVLHSKQDGSMYILLGHGGETVPGSLFALSLPDFYRYVKKLGPTAAVPSTLPGDYKGWDSLPKETPYGLIQIYKSESQGVMVPPVCVDITHDGVKDIVMAAYDGNIICYNGETLDKLWTASFPKLESYSSPAPGYFNDDDVLDFMMHFNDGEWPNYKQSMSVVIDGKTGQTLWSLNATKMDMNSVLTVSTAETHRDMYLYRIQGRKGANGKKRRKRDAASYRQNSDYGYEDNRNGGVQDYDYYNRGRYPPVQQSPYKNPGSLNRADPPGLRGSAPSQGYNGRKPYSRYPYTNTKSFPSYAESQDGWQLDPRARNQEYGGPSTRYNIDKIDYNVDIDQEEGDNAADHEDDDGDDDHDDHAEPQSPNCDEDITQYASEIFLMDRSTVSEPLLVRRIPARRFYYNVTAEDIDVLRKWAAAMAGQDLANTHMGKRDINNDQRVKRHGDKDKTPKHTIADTPSTTCSVMMTEEKSSGALGDLDGDGKLDMAGVNYFSTDILDAHGNYIKSKFITQIFKVNLEKKLRSGEYTGTKINAKVSPEMKKLKTNKAMNHLKIKSWKDQPWREYLGSEGTSIYRQTETTS